MPTKRNELTLVSRNRRRLSGVNWLMSGRMSNGQSRQENSSPKKLFCVIKTFNMASVFLKQKAIVTNLHFLFSFTTFIGNTAEIQFTHEQSRNSWSASLTPRKKKLVDLFIEQLRQSYRTFLAEKPNLVLTENYKIQQH